MSSRDKNQNLWIFCRLLSRKETRDRTRQKTHSFWFLSLEDSKPLVEHDRIRKNSLVLTLHSGGHYPTCRCPPLAQPRHKTRPLALVWFLTVPKLDLNHVPIITYVRLVQTLEYIGMYRCQYHAQSESAEWNQNWRSYTTFMIPAGNNTSLRRI